MASTLNPSRAAQLSHKPELIHSRTATAALWFGMLLLITPVFGEQAASESAQSLTNWLAATLSFQKAGALVGKENYLQANAELSSATTNLPPPYNRIAAEFFAQLESALKLPTNHNDPRRLRALIDLCTDLRAHQAALQCASKTGTNVLPEDLADDALYAWRLFESGDTQAALAEYRRRMAKESVDTWQTYYAEQIRLLQQRQANLTNSHFSIELVKEHYLKGLEAPADLFGALSELTRAARYAPSARAAVPLYERIFKCFSALGDEAGRKAWQDKLLAEYKSDPEACAMVYLDRGQEAYHRKDMNGAEALFKKVCAEYSTLSVYGDALYGLGLVLQEEARYDEAIAEYSRIFPSNAQDKILDLDSSEDLPNYRFKAALRISECYESKKDFGKALEYALLARDRYPFHSYCKDCTRQTRQNVENRVKRLQEAVKQREPSAPPDAARQGF